MLTIKKSGAMLPVLVAHDWSLCKFCDWCKIDRSRRWLAKNVAVGLARSAKPVNSMIAEKSAILVADWPEIRPFDWLMSWIL